MQPWEKYKTLQIKWTITKAVEYGFLYVYMACYKLQISMVSQIIFYCKTMLLIWLVNETEKYVLIDFVNG